MVDLYLTGAATVCAFVCGVNVGIVLQRLSQAGKG